MPVEPADEPIRMTLQSNNIVLYMKGSPDAPQCGFSAHAVQLLNACGAKFAWVDVLINPDIREGIKRYSNWPTIPQLYINGELIGGRDIMAELYQRGELQKRVSEATEQQS